MIKQVVKSIPKMNIPSDFNKEEVMNIFNCAIGECFSFTTRNIKSWKTLFYKINREEFSDRKFMFKKQRSKMNETQLYNVWRIL